MSLLSGILQIVRLREAGFSAIVATRQSFLNSLAPLLAFPLVGAIGGLMAGQVRLGLSSFLLAVVALLTPLVLTHAFAKRWGRERAWLRFAIASNWTQCVVAIVLVFLLGMMGDTGGPSIGPAQLLLLLCVVAYGLVLHWFLARRGLDLPNRLAVLLVLVTDLGTGTLVMGLGALSASLQ